MTQQTVTKTSQISNCLQIACGTGMVTRHQLTGYICLRLRIQTLKISIESMCADTVSDGVVSQCY